MFLALFGMVSFGVVRLASALGSQRRRALDEKSTESPLDPDVVLPGNALHAGLEREAPDRGEDDSGETRRSVLVGGRIVQVWDRVVLDISKGSPLTKEELRRQGFSVELLVMGLRMEAGFDVLEEQLLQSLVRPPSAEGLQFLDMSLAIEAVEDGP